MIKICILLKLFYKVNIIWIKVSADLFLVENGNIILKFTWKCQRFRMAKTTLNNINFGGLTLSHFKTYYEAIVIKTLWDEHQNR